MKLFKFGLRLWILITSVMSFLLGWIMLAHAPKPTQTSAPAPINSVATIPTLAPLPNLNIGSSQNNGNLFQNPLFSVQPSIQTLPQPSNNFAAAPVFRTSGS
jgi:hypothetical protein